MTNKNSHNNWLKKRLKSFTLIEIMVALIITGIVASMATWAFSNVQKYVTAYWKNEAQNLDFAQFISMLNKDMLESETINYQNDKLLFIRNNSEVLEYSFYDYCIVRSDKRIDDTLFIEINMFGVTPLEIEPNLIKEISVTLIMGKVEYPMVFTKYYSRQQIFSLTYGYTD